MGPQELHLHGVQFRCESYTDTDGYAHDDTDPFQPFSIAFSCTKQHSNWCHSDVYCFDIKRAISGRHRELRDGRDGGHGFELLA